MDKILRAIKNNEVSQLLVGEGEYQIASYEYPEPQNYHAVWNYEICPFIENAENVPILEEKLNASFVELTNYSKDINKGLYTFAVNLFIYYSHLKKNWVNFRISIEELIPIFKKALREHKSSLIEDKRWAGADWNKAGNKGKGVYGAIFRIIGSIKEQCNGPDLIPLLF